MSVPIQLFTKDPDATETFGIDWTRFPGSSSPVGSGYLGAETISAASWPGVPAGITEVSHSNTTTTTQITLSGGTDNTDYDLVCRITTSGSRITDRTIRIQVRQQ